MRCRVGLVGYAEAGAASSAPTTNIFGACLGRMRDGRTGRSWRPHHRVGGAVAFGRLRPVLLVAPVGADPKPNFHRNNDRKSEGGMQGHVCCVFFELFAFNGGFFGYGGALHFASFDRGQAGQNPDPSHTEGFGTHAIREPSSELSVWYYPPCGQVNRQRH